MHSVISDCKERKAVRPRSQLSNNHRQNLRNCSPLFVGVSARILNIIEHGAVYGFALNIIEHGGENMPRKVKARELDSREARSKLKPRGMPYYKALDKELHVGYRRLRGKSGTWWMRRYEGNGRYAVESIGTADDQGAADGNEVLTFWQAQDKARARYGLHLATGAHGPLTVKDAVGAYLQFLETSRKPSTAQDTRCRAAAFILPQLGSIEVAELTKEQLEHWHHGLAKTKARVRTKSGDKQQYRVVPDEEEGHRKRRVSANRMLSILKAALNRAWRDGKVPSDSAWRRVEKFEKVELARTRYLSIEEARRLVNASDPKFRVLVQAALQTGARYGELARLQVHDFNRDAGTVAIHRSKSGKPRHIILNDEGRAFFEQVTAGRSGNELMLGSWKSSHQRRPMIEAVERAKIKPAISFHGLRHTWASLAVMNGVPFMVVARNLGHADTRMVEEHYGHLAPDYIKEAIRKGAPKFGFKTDNKVARLG
jgi:integrase